MKKILTKTFIVALFISLTSATIVPVTDSTKQAGNINYKQLKTDFEKMKGEKLTLKEKIALKLFNKQLSKMEIDRGLDAKPGKDGGKSQLIALILCVFLGGIGIHRFYLGYTWQGVVQILTGGGCGVWWLIDLVRIIMGTLKPKDGSYTETL